MGSLHRDTHKHSRPCVCTHMRTHEHTHTQTYTYIHKPSRILAKARYARKYSGTRSLGASSAPYCVCVRVCVCTFVCMHVYVYV